MCRTSIIMRSCPTKNKVNDAESVREGTLGCESLARPMQGFPKNQVRSTQMSG